MAKRAFIAAIILHSFIFLGFPSGHGYAVMIMLEAVSLPIIIRNGLTSLDSYTFEVFTVALASISFLGKILAVFSLFKKDISIRNKWIYRSLGILLFAFVWICFSTYQYDIFLFAMTLGSGVPFIMYAARTFYLLKVIKPEQQ